MENTAFSIISGISIILILLPLPWHWNARNYGTLLYIGWTFFGTVMYFANSIIWRGNLLNPAPVWCDISAKLAIGLGVALPAVSLCINRRLYNIATMKHVASSQSEKRRQTGVDFAIGLGIPFLVMILHYVVQGHRYDVVEDMGCIPSTFATPPMIPLVMIWPPLLGVISLVYCGLSMHAFMKQRRTFNSVLNSHNSSLNVSRYLRLMALAATDILFDLPLSLFFVWYNTKNGLEPWVSWSDTHYNFSRVDFIPQASLKAYPVAWTALSINRWALPVAAILFFVFFGLAGESLATYKRFFSRFTKSLPSARIPKSSLWRSKSSPTHIPAAFSMSSVNIVVERTQDIDVESVADVKTPDYASLHSSATEKFVPISFPDLGREVGLNHSVDSFDPSYNHSPPPFSSITSFKAHPIRTL